MADPELHELVAALRRETVELGRRISRLESHGGLDDLPPQAVEDPPAAERGYSDLFTRLAILCFALVGALVLRAATDQGLVEVHLGTALGLAYCAALFLTAQVRAWLPRLPESVTTLQYCAVALVPVVVLETFHRHQALSAAAAAAVLLATGVLGAAAALRSERRGLFVLAVLASAVGLGGLGAPQHAAEWRAAGMTLLTGITLCAAHRQGWRWLRGLVLTSLGLLLAAGVVRTARHQEVAPRTAAVVLGCALLAALLVAVSHLLRARRLSATEAAWLPAAGLWAAGLLLWYSRQDGAAWVVSSGALLLPVAVGLAHLRRAGTAAVAAAVAGALVTCVGLLLVDRTGLALATLALTVWLVAAAIDSIWCTRLAHLLVLPAFAVGIGRAGLLTGGAGAGLSAALGFSALALTQFGLATQRDGRGPLSPTRALPLVAGGVMLFLGLRIAALRAFGPGATAQLAQIAALVIISLVALAVSRRVRDPLMRWTGVAAVVVLSAKVILVDVVSGKGAVVVASLALVGVSFGGTAALLRRETAVRPPPGSEPAHEP